MLCGQMFEHPREPLLSRFRVLAGAPRELWIVFAAKLVGIAAYSVMNTTFVLWLSSDLGYSDQWAGAVVAWWSAAMTLFTVFVGSLTDAIGLRKAILLGLVVTVTSRGVMAFSGVTWLALAGGMLPLALGEALGVPVLVAAVRRYSTTAQSSMAFAVFYAMQNLGFLAANYIFNAVRQGLGEPHGHWTLPWLGLEFTTYRVLFLISFLIELSMLPVVYFTLREGVEATDAGVKITPGVSGRRGTNFLQALYSTTRQALRDTLRIFAGLWGQSGFYKFLAFLALAAFVRLIFIHMYYTYPKFGIRELGEGAPLGRLFAINSVLIVLLVPVVGALAQRVSAYRMVTLGSAVAAASVFFMALPPRWFQGLADGSLGHAIANVWLGGDTRFSPDDFRDLPALAARLQAPSDAASAALAQALSGPTRSLLRRELGLPARPASTQPHPSSALFAASDISDAAALAARLRDDAQAATRPVSAWLWAQFRPSSRARLADGKCPASEQGALLANELNRLLNGKGLYDEHRFAAVSLSGSAQALLVKGPQRGRADALPNQTVLLNRLLLEDAYGGQLARTSHPLRVALTEDLSKLIKSGPLDRRPGFQGLAPRERAPGQSARPPSGSKLARLNRRLLEDAFPSELARNRPGVPGSVEPVLRDDLPLHRAAVGGRIHLLAPALRICRHHRAQGTRGLLYVPLLSALLPCQAPGGHVLRRLAGQVLSGDRPTPRRHVVADHCPDYVDRPAGPHHPPAPDPGPRGRPGRSPVNRIALFRAGWVC